MLRNNYFGETKTHYKLVKKGKAWVAIGVTTFSVGLSMFLTNYNVHADNTVVENESIDSGATDNETQTVMLKSSGAKNNDSILDETNEVSQAASATSAVENQSSSSAASASSTKSSAAESSSANKDEHETAAISASTADNQSSSSAAKADTTSTSSSSAAKADTTSTSSSSAAKADTTSTSSSSAAKADMTSTSSSSAAEADVTIVKTKKSDKLISASSDEPTINVSRKTADLIVGGNTLAISASVTIGQSQTIKAGTKIIISGLSSTYFDFSTAWGNGSESYGTYSADEASGQVIYTFTSDITNPGNLVMNWFITSKAVSTTTPITTINASYVDDENNSRVLTSTEFPNPNFTLTVNSPVPGKETRVQANTNNNGANLPVKDTIAYTSLGVLYFTPTQQYVMNTYILDPGGLTNSQINRTYTISASGNGVRLSADFVSIALNDNVANYMSLAKAQAAGYLTYVVNSDGSIAITWTNGQSIRFNCINVAIYAPDLSDTYTITSTYTSDSGTAGLTVTKLSNKLAYVDSGTGFIPDITANDKTINVNDTIDDVNSWLLNGVTATDVEDGNLTSKIVISNDGGFINAWNNKTSGKYQVTYSVTDSDGNIVSSTVTITISAAAIDTKDSTLVAGPNTTWSAGDNLVSATDTDGKALSLADLK
ncbi:immunoglobulin-like domain-containing protein, partial [Lactiplantibacillus plantarum]|uniref:immunoglobulin-like domain-containing protein n=1 Tax=Lactiplantibacillus plantarum TaxID=1590 RepID=UPI0017736BEF